MDKKHKKEMLEDFRGLKLEELQSQKTKIQEDLTLMRFKNKSGQLDDLGAYRRTKKAYARLQSVIQEKVSAE
ncbi:MAG: 50S ribosomal protein L29 [Bdellovibrionota bacterium]|nr:50S ribosomal protein L29 [Deltaproteobacteria bacterium]